MPLNLKLRGWRDQQFPSLKEVSKYNAMKETAAAPVKDVFRGETKFYEEMSDLLEGGKKITQVLLMSTVLDSSYIGSIGIGYKPYGLYLNISEINTIPFIAVDENGKPRDFCDLKLENIKNSFSIYYDRLDKDEGPFTSFKDLIDTLDWTGEQAEVNYAAFTKSLSPLCNFENMLLERVYFMPIFLGQQSGQYVYRVYHCYKTLQPVLIPMMSISSKKILRNIRYSGTLCEMYIDISYSSEQSDDDILKDVFGYFDHTEISYNNWFISYEHGSTLLNEKSAYYYNGKKKFSYYVNYYRPFHQLYNCDEERPIIDIYNYNLQYYDSYKRTLRGDWSNPTHTNISEDFLMANSYPYVENVRFKTNVDSPY